MPVNDDAINNEQVFCVYKSKKLQKPHTDSWMVAFKPDKIEIWVHVLYKSMLSLLPGKKIYDSFWLCCSDSHHLSSTIIHLHESRFRLCCSWWLMKKKNSCSLTKIMESSREYENEWYSELDICEKMLTSHMQSEYGCQKTEIEKLVTYLRAITTCDIKRTQKMNVIDDF